MRYLKVVLLAMFIGFGVTAYDAEATKMKFYILTSEEKGAQFTNDVASLAEQAGLRAAAAQVTDDRGNTTSIVNARKRWIWLAGGNVLLSGNEDPALCGRYDKPHPDPGQFFVAIESLIPFLGKKRVVEISNTLQIGLLERGYDVRQKPVMCSTLSKLHSKQNNSQ